MYLCATNHNREPGEIKIKQISLDDLFNLAGERYDDTEIVNNIEEASKVLESVLDDITQLSELDRLDFLAAMREKITLDAYILQQLIKAASQFVEG